MAFLGGTIGNLDPKQRAEFLAALAANLAPGDGLLLGTDLVKDPARLVAAYDDAAGVTAAFNRNVLAVVNRELGADFDLDRFAHVARWDAEQEWIEMRLRSTVAQAVTVADLGLVVDFEAGEEMRTEISAKFRRDGVDAELAAAGLDLRPVVDRPRRRLRPLPVFPGVAGPGISASEAGFSGVRRAISGARQIFGELPGSNSPGRRDWARVGWVVGAYGVPSSSRAFRASVTAGSRALRRLAGGGPPGGHRPGGTRPAWCRRATAGQRRPLLLL